MKKLAIFVEGNTELVVIEQIVFEVAGRLDVNIQRHKLHGDKTLVLRDRGVQRNDARFHVLITDCGGEDQVKSAILDRQLSLTAAGYHRVLGVRDVYPTHKRSELGRLRRAVQTGLDIYPIPAHIVLAVMEIEAWFLGEWTHFTHVDPMLTTTFIHTKTGFDFPNISVEEIAAPAKLLNEIYTLVGKSYKKKDKDAHGIASRLDYTRLYIEARKNLPSLDEFLSHLDAFFTVAP